MRNLKANLWVVPITLLVTIIVSLILGLTGLNWKYYLIGSLLGLMNHSIMVKQNARMVRMVQLDPDHTVFNPKKSALLWYLIRMGLFLGVFVVLVYFSNIKNDHSKIWDIVIALGGYIVMKIIFVLCLVFFKEKKVKDK